LLAALLAWLDARSRKAQLVLRLEDIAPYGIRDEWRQGLIDDLTWFGLDWDQTVWQSKQRVNHEALLDQLAETGRLYVCSCTRSTVAKAGIPSLAGGWVYPGTCRNHRVKDWRSAEGNIRLDLSDFAIELQDESGLDLSQLPGRDMGDPLLHRVDGSFSYMLAVVADDHAVGVTRIVRGRDLASSSATQTALYRLCGWQEPTYRHHMLFLEHQGEKFAKLHGAVGADTLKLVYDAGTLRGMLSRAAGFWQGAGPVTTSELLSTFDWNQVSKNDVTLRWHESELQIQREGVFHRLCD